MTKQHNIWLFGNGLSLDFNHNPPQTGYGPLHSLEGCATFSHPETGAMLFATDGLRIWDGQDTEVSGIAPQGQSSSTNAGIIVPMPGSPGRFYVLSSGEVSGIDGFWNPDGSIDIHAAVTFNPNAGGAKGIHVTEVEVRPDGSVSVLSSAQPLADFDPEAVTEKLCIVARDNCRDYWLITGLRDELIVYSVEPGGIHRVGTHAPVHPVSPVGYIRVSPDGRRLAVASYRLQKPSIDADAPGTVTLYDFDMTSGAITHGRTILNPRQQRHGFPYGLEFSPNSQRLYYSLSHRKNKTGTIVQIDLENGDAATRIAELPQTPTGTIPHTKMATGALLRGPDGVIYAARSGTRFLAAIPNPDLPGLDCGFEAEAIAFGEDDTMFWGLPTLVEFRGCEPEVPDEPTTPTTGSGCTPCETEHCVTISWSPGTQACITISTDSACACATKVETKPACPCTNPET